MNRTLASLNEAAESALRPSRLASYRDLFERTRDPVFLLDGDDFTVIDCNPAAETRFKRSSSQLLGTGLDEWLTPECFEQLQSLFRKARRTYHPKKHQLAWKVDGEQLIFEVISCSLSLSTQKLAIQVILQDVTLMAKAMQHLEEMSIRDEMTQLSNYRYFKSELQREHVRASTEGGSYSIIFCDVDHFKSFNDRLGHPAGDALLRLLSKVILGQCRGADLAARYGGEEFAVLCRGTPPQGAKILAERIRSGVEEFPFDGGEGQPLGKVTLSIGVAGFPHHANTPEIVLETADAALYRSKQGGRNRVTSA